MFEAYPGTLPLARDEIRLIRLLRGAWSDDIRCQLVYDTLSNVRPYHAVSYVWGSPKKTKQILLDARSFDVTNNLESALRHLRSPTEDILLWVDALCINQADDLERTHQVNLMGSIYRSSKGVLVYLGDGVDRYGRVRNSKFNSKAPRTTTFFNTTEDARYVHEVLQADNCHTFATLKRSERDDRMQSTVNVFSFIRALSWVDHLVEIPWLASKTDDLDVEKALRHIFENLRRLMHAPFTPWWNRMWVVQEVILPPQVTVICGTVSAPWTMLAQAASQCLHHLHDCCSKRLEHLPRDLLNVLQDFGERIMDIEILRKTFSEQTIQAKRMCSETTILDLRDCTPEQRSLGSLLRRFRDRKASDPRDKVYALLSLVQSTSNRPPLSPDYSLSSAEVYQMAALEAIYSSASLSVLTVDVARKYRQDLPTWVPDWEAPGDFSYNTRLDAMGIYDACTMYSVNPGTVTNHGRALVLEGLPIDVVEASGDVMLSDSSDTFLKTIRGWISLNRSFRPVTGTKTSDRALWRVFCADAILLQLHSTESGSDFRLIEDEDELMFATWALLSKRSPFYNSKIPIQDYLSSTAQKWVTIINLEAAILQKDTNEIARHFFSLFPEESEHKAYIERAVSRHKGLSEEDRKRLVKYATSTLARIEESDWDQYVKDAAAKGQSLDETNAKRVRKALRARAQRKREGAWKEIAWSEVLEHVRPQLMRGLGSASKIGQIPYDVQVALIDRSIVSATKARRFFITRDGGIGLGPADLERGDFLYLLKGARTPSILRPYGGWYHCGDVTCETCNKPRISCFCGDLRCDLCGSRGFKVIGDCYAMDLMDSESVNSYVEERGTSSWTETNLV